MEPRPEIEPAFGTERRSSARRVETRVRIAAGVVLVALLAFIVSATRSEPRPDRWVHVEYEVQGLH